MGATRNAASAAEMKALISRLGDLDERIERRLESERAHKDRTGMWPGEMASEFLRRERDRVLARLVALGYRG